MEYLYIVESVRDSVYLLILPVVGANKVPLFSGSPLQKFLRPVVCISGHTWPLCAESCRSTVSL